MQSYGVAAVTRGSKKVLLLYNTKGFWDYPKGAPETGETGIQTALREFEEESGLSSQLLELNSEHIDYAFPTKKGEKRVRLFFAFMGTEPRAEEFKYHAKEISAHEFVELKDLESKMKYPEDKDLARRIISRLTSESS